MRFPLEEVPGKAKLHWQPRPGEFLETQVEATFRRAVMKRPAAKAKMGAKAEKEMEEKEEAEERKDEVDECERDASQEEEEEEEEEEAEDEDSQEGRQDKNDALEDDEAYEEEADEEAEEGERNKKGPEQEEASEEGEEKNEGNEEEKNEGKEEEKNEAKAGKCPTKKVRATRKRPCGNWESESLMDGTYKVSAATGKNIRAYLMARAGKTKRFLICVTAKEHQKYQQIITQIQKEAEHKIGLGNITFTSLKEWANGKKKELLS